ncbi:MAG: hypothetical protein HYY62_03285 [Deltaproteobacteria bacterium]|nr:hypothetical protein [Deltaproteobacteria bacterium]
MVLSKIKRLILKGDYRFTDKADAEMEATGITKDDVVEAILNAYRIDKVMRTISPGKTHKGEKVYVIRGFTYDKMYIYTKGTIKIVDRDKNFYRLISAKREGIF